MVMVYVCVCVLCICCMWVEIIILLPREEIKYGYSIEEDAAESHQLSLVETWSDMLVEMTRAERTNAFATWLQQK